MTKFVIKKSDIVHNYEAVVSKTHALVIPTLKADCYGLGAVQVRDILHNECGVSLFAVSRLHEAVSLCGEGIDILLLSCYHDTDSIAKAVDQGIILAVDSLAQANDIASCAKSKSKTARVHIKIDTGFGRFGFNPANISDIKAVYSLDGLAVEGIFSHFSSAFAKDLKITDRQFDTFSGVVSELEKSGINVGLRHIANTSAALRTDKYRLDAVRIGSALLGRTPVKTDTDLIRVGSFETTVTDIRNLKKGANIGYGNVFTLKKDTRVAVVCVGSADGVLIKKDYDTYRFIDILRYGFHAFKMLFSDNAMRVKINGKTAKTVGRTALTHTFIDVTDIDCECGDTVMFDISPLYVSHTVEREYI